MSGNTSIEWYDLSRYMTSPYTFIFSIGGRGIGKTYSMLKYLSKPRESKFLYLRRMDKEFKMCASDAGNPFKKINEDTENKIQITVKRQVGMFYQDDIHNVIGYAAPLTGAGALRGFDMSDVDVIFYDEFIGQKETRSIRNEADAFFNLYETVNRNRELFGLPAVKCILASNAVSLNSPILMELGLIPTIEQMIIQGQERFRDRQRSVIIELPQVQQLREQKENTALYRLTHGTKFSSHALYNKFAYDSFFNIKKCPIDEYIPFAAYGDIYIYRHKTNSTFYACSIPADCPYYPDNKEGTIMFKRLFFKYKDYLYDGRMKFEDFTIKTIIWEVLIES